MSPIKSKLSAISAFVMIPTCSLLLGSNGMDLYDVLIVHHIVPFHLGSGRKHRAAPYAGVLKVRGHIAMDQLRDLQQGSAPFQRERLLVIRLFLRRQLGIDA